MSIRFSYKVDIWKRAAEQISHNQIAIVAQTSAENGWCAYQVTCKKKKLKKESWETGGKKYCILELEYQIKHWTKPVMVAIAQIRLV